MIRISDFGFRVSPSPSPARDTVAWAVYLACSWTWCIGMFLPVLLVRDFGVWGFIAFAVPNVVGAAAVGFFTYRQPAGDTLLDRHRPIMAAFSVVTIAFHVFFAAWMIRLLLGQWGLVLPFAATAIFYGYMTRPRRDFRACVLTLAISAVAAIVCFCHPGSMVPPPGGFTLSVAQASQPGLLGPGHRLRVSALPPSRSHLATRPHLQSARPVAAGICSGLRGDFFTIDPVHALLQRSDAKRALARWPRPAGPDRGHCVGHPHVDPVRLDRRASSPRAAHAANRRPPSHGNDRGVAGRRRRIALDEPAHAYLVWSERRRSDLPRFSGLLWPGLPRLHLDRHDLAQARL